jgi:hypothetical protein
MGQWGFESLRAYESRDNDLVLRRYFVPWKFERLLATRALYFSPASKFDDEAEGHYTTLDYREWDRQLGAPRIDPRARALASEAKATLARNNRRAVVINCWSLTDNAA